MDRRYLVKAQSGGAGARDGRWVGAKLADFFKKTGTWGSLAMFLLSLVSFFFLGLVFLRFAGSG